MTRSERTAAVTTIRGNSVTPKLVMKRASRVALAGQLKRNRHRACQDRGADEPGLIARIARAQKAKPAWT